MAENSKIEWTDHTFNPWRGCTKVSPGCANCYAETLSKRNPAVLGQWGPGKPRVLASDDMWKQPLKWEAAQAKYQAFMNGTAERPRVFCASLADWLDDEVPIEWLADFLKLIHDTPNLDWLLVTKRIGNLARMLGDWQTVPLLPNIWLGITVVNQAEADRDVPKLLRVPAAVRFLSVEPMLGPVDLERPRPGPDLDQGGGQMICQPWLIQSGIDWVICGGESGPKARPMHPDWARSLRDQCAAAGVAFNFKQWGQWVEVDGDKPTRTVRVESDIGETLASRCDGFISLAGEFVRSMDDATTDDPYRGLRRIGKKASGRVLDGRTHDGFPGAAS